MQSATSLGQEHPHEQRQEQRRRRLHQSRWAHIVGTGTVAMLTSCTALMINAEAQERTPSMLFENTSRSVLAGRAVHGREGRALSCNSTTSS